MYNLYIKRICFNPDINIQTDDEKLYLVLTHMYRPFIQEKNKTYSRKLKLTVYEKDSLVYFKRNNVMCHIPKETSLQVIENAIYENTTTDKDYLALHAAVVARDGKAYIFAGQTEVGKTTLCAYLTAKGYEYLSDDIVLINKSSLKVTPFLNPMHLRLSSIDVLKENDIDINDLIEIKYGCIHRLIKYYPDITEHKEYDIGGIFLIKRSIDNNEIKHLPAHSSFRKILESQVTPNINREIIQTIKDIINRGVYSIQYINMLYVINTIQNIRNN